MAKKRNLWDKDEVIKGEIHNLRTSIEFISERIKVCDYLLESYFDFLIQENKQFTHDVLINNNIAKEAIQKQKEYLIKQLKEKEDELRKIQS